MNIEELQETLAAFKPLQQTFQQFAAELEAIPESVLASAAALKAGGNSGSLLYPYIRGKAILEHINTV